MSKRLTAPAIAARKVARGDAPLVMVTAYDAPSARMAGEAGMDMILVGDSLAMVVLGFDDTMKITTREMVHHTAAVARADPGCFIVADLPWMSYHVSPADTVKNAAKLVRAGAHAVKLEGGHARLPMIEAIIDAEIPVMGHLGLTPQSTLAMGGFRVQGKSHHAAMGIVSDAKTLAHVGCFAVVIEGVPAEVGKLITNSVDIPTVGIGAGPDCDGQVLVYHDVLGIEERFKPKFVRRYGSASADGIAALSRYGEDVRSGAFPADEECYHLAADELEVLGLYGSDTAADDPLSQW